MPEAVRFGISLSTSAAAGADPLTDARHMEALGFDFLTVSDHPMGTHPTFEAWTLLSWIAGSTSRIGLSPNVLGLPYRSPAMVAKMAESLDRLSGGRLILGLGGGANDQAAAALGLAVRSAGEKVEALGEAVDIMRGLWAESTFSFTGNQFHVRDAQIEPKAVRRIPIWLGTYGSRALTLTGRVADGWAPSLPYAPRDRVVAMRERVMRAAAKAGRDRGEITCNLNVPILVRERARPRDISVVGSRDEVVEQLLNLVQIGFSALTFWPIGDEREQRELLAREVMPQVRAGLTER